MYVTFLSVPSKLSRSGIDIILLSLYESAMLLILLLSKWPDMSVTADIHYHILASAGTQNAMKGKGMSGKAGK